MPQTVLGALGGHMGHHWAFYSKTVAGDGSILGSLWVAFGTLGRPNASATLFGRTFLGTILDQKSEKRHPKRHPKNYTEKAKKHMPKGFQNDAEMDTQIYDCSCFLEKGNN